MGSTKLEKQLIEKSNKISELEATLGKERNEKRLKLQEERSMRESNKALIEAAQQTYVKQRAELQDQVTTLEADKKKLQEELEVKTSEIQMANERIKHMCFK